MNAKLQMMVDKSSVEAVDKANVERDQAIRERNEGIKAAELEASRKINNAYTMQLKAESEAKEAKSNLKNKAFLYFGLLSFTLLCCSVMNPQVRVDFVDFFVTVTTYLWDFFSACFDWLVSLSGEMEWYWAWLIRIIISLLVFGNLFGIGAVAVAICKKYKQRWCTLSLKVLVVTIAIISVFGEPIRKVLPINLILLFLLLQIGYLFALWFFDGYYEVRYRTEEWEQMQNS